MTTPILDTLDYIGTHRGVRHIDEQPAPTRWPDDMPGQCWAAYQGRRCAEHSGGAR